MNSIEVHNMFHSEARFARLKELFFTNFNIVQCSVLCYLVSRFSRLSFTLTCETEFDLDNKYQKSMIYLEYDNLQNL